MRCWVGVLLIVGCSAEYSVRVRATEALQTQANTVEVALVANCLSQSLLGPVTGDPYLRYDYGATAPSLGDVDPGDYGLFARFVDASCNVVASGCTDVALSARGSSVLSVDLEAVSGTACAAAEECVAGECVERGVGPLRDAGVDAGSSDARPVEADASEDDAGVMDAAMDVPPDVPLPTCPGSGVLFCNDFEAETLGLFTTITGMGSTATLTQDEAFSGQWALRLSAPQGSMQSSLTLREDDATLSGQRWVRSRFFIPPTSPGKSSTGPGPTAPSPR